MSDDVMFRAIFAVLTILLFIPRLARKRKKLPRKELVSGTIEILTSALTRLWAIGLLLYPWGFKFFDFAVPFPNWVRWLGVLFMVLCFPISIWIYRTLGEHFSQKLELLENHKLITNGPYYFVRHPMYTTFILCALAAGLVSANLVITLTGMAAAIIILLRIRNEETMLLERFGEKYREYMEKTGAVVPKLRLSG